MSTQAYSPGLEGVIAGETRLSFVNPDLNSLMYRGYDIRDLAEKSCYEEVAYLLLYGELPSRKAFEAFCTTLKQDREIPAEVLEHIRRYPRGVSPMDLLRTSVSLLSLSDPDAADNTREANLRKAARLVARMPALIADTHRLTQGQERVRPDSALGHAANFLYMLTGNKPDLETLRLFDVTLIAYADHGFNASTFAGRVTTSTLSDIYSGIVSAIGTLKGPLHGGANEEAMRMLQEIGTPENAEPFILSALATKRKIMGFGHREYKTGDPRAALMTGMAEALCERVGQPKWHRIATIITETMRREKNIHPNVDFPTAYVYYLMGLPIDLYTPIFALSRVAGWSAHIIEQLDHNRLIRPKALYDGPKHLDYVPLNQRG